MKNLILLFISLSFVSNNIFANVFDELQNQEGVLTPQQYGAIPDDGECDEAAFNQMFQAATTGAHTVIIPPGEYNICNTVEIPTNVKSPYFKISGYGATLFSNGDFTLLKRLPADQNEARVIISGSILIIEGLLFEGNNSGTGLHIGATYSVEVENCHFKNLHTGLLSEYSLNGRYHGLRFTNCTDKSFIGTSGSWEGAATVNSAFNGNTIANCRVDGADGATSHYEILAGDLNAIENCISEGEPPLHNVFVDTQNSNVVNHALTVRNFWIESTANYPSTFNGSTYFELRNMAGRYVSLENVQAYPGEQPDTLMHCQGSPSTLVHIKGYRGNTELIDNDSTKYGPYYIIENSISTPDSLEDNDWLNGDNWVGGIVPMGLNMEWRRSQNTGKTVISRHRTEVLSRRQ